MATRNTEVGLTVKAVVQGPTLTDYFKTVAAGAQGANRVVRSEFKAIADAYNDAFKNLGVDRTAKQVSEATKVAIQGINPQLAEFKRLMLGYAQAMTDAKGKLSQLDQFSEREETQLNNLVRRARELASIKPFDNWEDGEPGKWLAKLTTDLQTFAILSKNADFSLDMIAQVNGTEESSKRFLKAINEMKGGMRSLADFIPDSGKGNALVKPLTEAVRAARREREQFMKELGREIAQEGTQQDVIAEIKKLQQEAINDRNSDNDPRSKYYERFKNEAKELLDDTRGEIELQKELRDAIRETIQVRLAARDLYEGEDDLHQELEREELDRLGTIELEISRSIAVLELEQKKLDVARERKRVQESLADGTLQEQTENPYRAIETESGQKALLDIEKEFYPKIQDLNRLIRNMQNELAGTDEENLQKQRQIVDQTQALYEQKYRELGNLQKEYQNLLDFDRADSLDAPMKDILTEISNLSLQSESLSEQFAKAALEGERLKKELDGAGDEQRELIALADDAGFTGGRPPEPPDYAGADYLPDDDDEQNAIRQLAAYAQLRKEVEELARTKRELQAVEREAVQANDYKRAIDAQADLVDITDRQINLLRQRKDAEEALGISQANSNRAIAQLTNSYKDYDDRLERSSILLAEQYNAQNRAIAQARETQAAWSKQMATVGQAERAYKDYIDTSIKVGESTLLVGRSLADLANEAVETSQDVGRLNREMVELNQDAYERNIGDSPLAKHLAQIGRQAYRTSEDLDRASDMMQKYLEFYRKVETRGNTVGSVAGILPEGSIKRQMSQLSELTNIYRATEAQQLALSGYTSKFDKIMKGFKQNVVEGFFHGIGYEAVNALQDVVRQFRDFVIQSQDVFATFQQGMAEVYTIMPEASQQMRDLLAEDIAAIAQQYGYLQDEILPATYQALSLGIKPEGVASELEVAARAARASVSELEPTLQTGQALVNAYGGELYSLTEVYDLLFYAVKNGSLTMNDINNQMAPIIAVAGEVGVSLEDITAAMVVMSRQGDDMASISRLLSNALTQIQIPTTALGSAFEEAANVGFREFIEGGGTLVEALGLIDEKALEANLSLTGIVGGDSPFYRDQQAMIAVLELTGKHLASFNDHAEAARNSAGLMDNAFEEVSETTFLLGQQTAATTEELQRQLGEALEPTTRAWLELKTAMAQALTLKVEGSEFGTSFKELSSLLTEQGVDRQEINRYWNDLYAAFMFEGRSVAQQMAGQGAFSDMGLDSYFLDPENNQYNASWEQFRKHNDANALFMSDAWAQYAQAFDLAVDSRKDFEDHFLNAAKVEDEATAIRNMTKAVELLIAGIPEDEILLDVNGEPAETELEAAIRLVREYYAEIENVPTLPEPRGATHGIFQDKQKQLEAQRVEVEQVAEEAADDFNKIIAKKIKDGDTVAIELNGELVDIRLRGLDTPEVGKLFGDKSEAFGREALRFTANFVADAGEVTVSDNFGESFDRQIRDIFGDGKQLDLALARKGLGIPVSLELIGDQKLYDQLQQAAREAAIRGEGMFGNTFVAEAFLANVVSSTEEVSRIYANMAQTFPGMVDHTQELNEQYDLMQEHSGEWVDTTIDHSRRISQIQAQLQQDLTDEQKKGLNTRLDDLEGFSDEYDAITKQLEGDLSDSERGKLIKELEQLQQTQGQPTRAFTGDTEKYEEARDKVRELNEEMKDYFKNLAFESLVGAEGLTAHTAQVGVALGLFDQATADYALKLTTLEEQLKGMVDWPEFIALSAENRAQAMGSLIQGYYDTIEAAIGGAQLTERIDSAFASGYGTQIYHDIANGVDAQAPLAPQITPVINRSQFDVQWAFIQSEIDAYTSAEEPPTAYPDIDDTVFWEKYNVMQNEAIIPYQTATPTIIFKEENLTEIAKETKEFIDEYGHDREITWDYYINVHGSTPDGGGKAAGGPVYPGEAYIVGELGPELLVMGNSGGTIIPNHVAFGQTGSGSVYDIKVYVDARGARKDDVFRVRNAARDGVRKAIERHGR